MTILAAELQPGMILRLGGVGYLVTRVKLRRNSVHLKFQGHHTSKARPLRLRAASRVEISVHPLTQGVPS